MSSSWSEICRICSSPGYYSIFAKIPVYLHCQPQEYLNWQRPIYEMLQDTTGLKIVQNDGLPENVCALCISYLKHAVTFHDQAVNNTRSLKAIQLLLSIKKENCAEKSEQIKNENQLLENASSDNYLLMNINRSGISKVNKELFSKYWQFELGEPPTVSEMDTQLRHLAYVFYGNKCAKRNKNYQRYKNKFSQAVDEESISSGDDNQIESATAGECLFSYEEKHFQEDDMVGAADPENCYERKCRACHHRFLLDNSFSQHLDMCVEYKFLLLIEELNLLLEIRRRKAISPHEYVRRVIFYLRKTCNWLAQNCDEIVTIPSGTCRRHEGDGNQIAETATTNLVATNNTILESTTGRNLVKKCRRGGKRHKSRCKSDYQAIDEDLDKQVEETCTFNTSKDNMNNKIGNLADQLSSCFMTQTNNDMHILQTSEQTAEEKTEQCFLQAIPDDMRLNIISPPASALPAPNLLN